MYIMITSRCNMTCEHCCFSCTEEGEDMSLDTFRKILSMNKGNYITIGGGEPTLHPEFKHFLIEAIASCDVWMATNGSVKDNALLLARLAERGVLGCDLSTDHYHDYGMVDPDVREAFKPTEFSDDKRGYRDVSRNVQNVGRAADTGVGIEDGCACSGLMIRPNGDVHWCGCPDAKKLGNVNTDFDVPDDHGESECYTEYMKNRDQNEEDENDKDLYEQYQSL